MAFKSDQPERKRALYLSLPQPPPSPLTSIDVTPNGQWEELMKLQKKWEIQQGVGFQGQLRVLCSVVTEVPATP